MSGVPPMGNDGRGSAEFWMPAYQDIAPNGTLVTQIRPPCGMKITRFLSESRARTFEILSIRCGMNDQLVPGTPPLPLDMFGHATDATLLLDTVLPWQDFQMEIKNISDIPAKFRMRVWVFVTDAPLFREFVKNIELDRVR
jgi:hypothetical protein